MGKNPRKYRNRLQKSRLLRPAVWGNEYQEIRLQGSRPEWYDHEDMGFERINNLRRDQVKHDSEHSVFKKI